MKYNTSFHLGLITKKIIQLQFVFSRFTTERSVVQFSKPSYPVIGNSTSVKLPVLRTGSFQRRVVVIWKTVADTAKDGVDYAGGEVCFYHYFLRMMLALFPIRNNKLISRIVNTVVRRIGSHQSSW